MYKYTPTVDWSVSFVKQIRRNRKETGQDRSDGQAGRAEDLVNVQKDEVASGTGLYVLGI